MGTNTKALLKTISDHEERIAKLEQILLRSSGRVDELKSTSKELSLRELMRKVKSSMNNVEKVLLTGYYLELHEGLKNFNADDIKRAFETSKEPELSNTLAFISQNIKNSNMMEVKEKKDNRKAYTLTASGENLVKELLSETKI
jgi:hypothetical protein